MIVKELHSVFQVMYFVGILEMYERQGHGSVLQYAKGSYAPFAAVQDGGRKRGNAVV